MIHLVKLLDLLASLCPVRVLAQHEGLLEPLVIIMNSCFQGVPHGFSQEGLRVVFEVLAGALLPTSGLHSNRAEPHPLLHLIIIGMFVRRDLAK